MQLDASTTTRRRPRSGNERRVLETDEWPRVSCSRLGRHAILCAASGRLARRAEVAELADALRSGRSGGNPVGVQISPSAPPVRWPVGHRERCRAGRSLAPLRCQRKVRAAQSRVPGVNPGQRGPAPLTVQTGTSGMARRESNRDNNRALPGVKRAILPAAISDRAAIRLLAEARG